MIEEYTDGISMTMVPNPNWYGEGPNLETVTTRFITGQGEQMTAVQNNEVDLVYAIPTVDTKEQAESLPEMTIETGSTLTYFHLGMKTTGDVMSDPALRSAIATAFDLGDMRERTIAQYAPDIPQMRSSVYVPGQQIGGVDAYEDNMDELGIGEGDVDAAIKILEDAGYAIDDGQLIQPDGSALRDLTFLTLGTDSLRMELAQMPSSNSRNWHHRHYRSGRWLDTAPRCVTAPSTSWPPARPRPGPTLDAAVVRHRCPSSFGYSNPRPTSYLRQPTEIDPAARVELMNELDRVLLADGVYYLFATPMMAVYREQYSNIFVNPSKYGTTMNIEEWGLSAN